jgi:hypothetical protein
MAIIWVVNVLQNIVYLIPLPLFSPVLALSNTIIVLGFVVLIDISVHYQAK